MPITIYMIENRVNGKKYVGQTRQSLKGRFWYHCNYPGCTYLHRAIKLHDKENFFIRALFVCPDDQDYANEMEKRAIEVYGTMVPSGYNIREGGSRGRHSEESNEKNRQAHLGFRHSEEFKRRKAKQQSNRMKSLENRNAISKALTGIKRSDETKKKMSDGQRGHSRNKGFRHSIETKQKMSQIAKKRQYSEETRNKMSKSAKDRIVRDGPTKASEEARMKMSIAAKKREAAKRETRVNT